MSYSYQRKTHPEIEALADSIRSEHPDRRKGSSIDIELILDDLNIDIVYRRGLNKYVEGYLSRDRSKIVMEETRFTNPARARFTLSEEFCHRILEEDLWDDDDLCDMNRCDRLSQKQHDDIEADARRLAGALLMPKSEFISLYSSKDRELQTAGVRERDRVRPCLSEMARVFDVSQHAAGYRAMDLGLLSKTRLFELFPS